VFTLFEKKKDYKKAAEICVSLLEKYPRWCNTLAMLALIRHRDNIDRPYQMDQAARAI
ncbi:hypothetical protein KIPB_017367, partial [Kipferlia bialata]